MNMNSSMITNISASITSQFKDLTGKILIEQPFVKDWYLCLDPMLKFNFDQTLSTTINCVVHKFLETLEIYCVLSSGELSQFYGPNKFYNEATGENKKLQESLKKRLNKSLLINYIREILKSFGGSFFDRNIKKINEKFDEVYQEIDNAEKRNRKTLWSKLLSSELLTKLKNEKIMDKKIKEIE